MAATNSNEVFVLKGVTINNNIGPQKAGGSKPRKNEDDIVIDDFKNERAMLDKHTVAIPSFKMLTKEGLLYPEETHRHCQWDRWPITWRPVGLPIKKMIQGNVGVYFCIRFFCSLECCCSYYKDNFKKDPQLTDVTLKYLEEINVLILKHLGQVYQPLKEARDWNELERTGSGDLKIDAFRESCKTRLQKLNTIVFLRLPELYLKLQEE
jgi:hypothetical protein